MYALIVGILILVFMLESSDWLCDDIWGNMLTVCKGEGMPCRGSLPSEDDNVQALMGRIKSAAKAETRHIKWRRAMIYSILIMFAIWGLAVTPGRLPNWEQFYLTVIICFAFLYFGFNFFSYHYNTIAEENILKSLKLLKTKLNE